MVTLSFVFGVVIGVVGADGFKLAFAKLREILSSKDR